MLVTGLMWMVDRHTLKTIHKAEIDRRTDADIRRIIGSGFVKCDLSQKSN